MKYLKYLLILVGPLSLGVATLPAYADTGVGVSVELTTVITGDGSGGGGGGWYYNPPQQQQVVTTIPQSSSPYIPIVQQPVNIPPVNNQATLPQSSEPITSPVVAESYNSNIAQIAWVGFWALLIALAIVVFWVWRDWKKKRI